VGYLGVSGVLGGAGVERKLGRKNFASDRNDRHFVVDVEF
jgi:hypothetical protein